MVVEIVHFAGRVVLFGLNWPSLLAGGDQSLILNGSHQGNPPTLLDIWPIHYNVYENKFQPYTHTKLTFYDCYLLSLQNMTLTF